MNLQQAYSILNLSPSVSPEEAKKQYRKLTKEYHPDVNKSPDAEEKFKQINEAYECVKNGRGNEVNKSSYPGRVVHVEHVNLNVSISFKESVLGTKKEIKYSRLSKCPTCDGDGSVKIDNGCSKCNGRGQTVNRQGNSVFIISCPQCGGQVKLEDCKMCQHVGTVHTDVSIHVSVPAGVADGNTLRLQGMGNYMGSLLGMMDQYTDAYCHIHVQSEEGLSIEGKNVISAINISLLNALTGCQRTVKTIYGDKEINIPAKSKNKEEVIIPKCGVSGIGDQKVLLNVQYPENIQMLIDTLTVNEG